MTEDDAKTKWCPFVRVLVSDPGAGLAPAAYNRVCTSEGNSGVDESNNCIGSACMAWRNITEKSSSGTARNLFIKYEVVGGYCGLAGKP